DADQVAGLCLGTQCFGQSRDSVPQFAEGERSVRVLNCDAVSVSAGHSLEVLDDRPLQILVAKVRKQPIRGPVPVQWARIVRQPRERLEYFEIAAQQRVASLGVRGHWVSGVFCLRRRESTAFSR